MVGHAQKFWAGCGRRISLREISGAIEALEKRYDSLNKRMSDPEAIADRREYESLARESVEVAPILQEGKRWREFKAREAESLELLKSSDREIVELAREELAELAGLIAESESKLRLALTPRDPNDDKNAILEIRAGTGGLEAALFAADLFRMYSRYAERLGWVFELLSLNETGIGGFKEAIVHIKGRSVFRRLKFESGAHRVQRVPKTESSGRLHTSAVTVAILPEAEEIDVPIDPSDLRIDLFRSSGHGGQSVNTTDSAVRITHIPTGLTVSIQDEKSQHKNRVKAMKILRARLKADAEERERAKRAAARKAQVGWGDRSERIRTYNFPQGRVTDHRISKTIYKIDAFMDGDLNEMIDDLILADSENAIKERLTEEE